ncbi:hypothetical protein MNBD_GAMMA06-908 [hydrothermal vent metagenome]|uniref:Sigma factor RpoE regulatory protein RseC n=1 Tax=hydrothermal vent metagenome TaxID=652676 RepID=A0A3B0W819_9ZZZZ
MIEKKAQVIEIKGSQLVLQAQTQSACGSCSASKGCGTSVLAKVIGRKFTQFQVENNVDAKIGDIVVVGISEDALLNGSLVMYIIPILGMMFFSVSANYFLAPVLYFLDLIIAVSGIMGLIFGSLIAREYFQHQSSRQRFTPVVLRKIIEHGKLQVR